jgi:hypothetical protein
MNTPAKIKHPDWMDDEDIASYDNLISMGRNQLGKEIAKNEEFLLHISAIIAIKKHKGLPTELDDDTIEKLKKVHSDFREAGLIFETPPDGFYESARILKEPYLPEDVKKEIDDANSLCSSNIVIDKKSSNIADEGNDVIDDMLVVDGVAKVIQKDWVKLVQPCDDNVCLSCGS